MSLAIEIEAVTAVLLLDGWHEIEVCSFVLDSYEFVDDNDETVHGGGQSGVCATGFAFRDRETNKYLCGPMTSILAVQTT